MQKYISGIIVYIYSTYLHRVVILAAAADVTGFHSFLCDANALPQMKCVCFVYSQESNSLTIFTSTIIWKVINNIEYIIQNRNQFMYSILLDSINII